MDSKLIKKLYKISRIIIAIITFIVFNIMYINEDISWKILPIFFAVLSYGFSFPSSIISERLITGKIGSNIDNINETKTQTAIEKYYFRKLQSMTMEQMSNIHTGYIHKLITNVSRYFFEMTWQFEISVIPLIIGGSYE